MNNLKKLVNTIKVLKCVCILLSMVDLWFITFNQYKKCSDKFGIVIPLISRYNLVNWLFMCLPTMFVINGIYTEQLMTIMILPSVSLVCLSGHFLNIALIPCETIKNFLITHMLVGFNLALFIQWKHRMARELIVCCRRYE